MAIGSVHAIPELVDGDSSDFGPRDTLANRAACQFVDHQLAENDARMRAEHSRIAAYPRRAANGRYGRFPC